jgi:hypothetical protein
VERLSLVSPSKDIKMVTASPAPWQAQVPHDGSVRTEQQTSHALHQQGSRRQIVEYIGPQHSG